MQAKPTNTERKTLVEAFTELPDPRVRVRCDHLLHEVLVIAVCGMLVGGESFYDMEDFASESEGWLRGGASAPEGEVVALDGKAVRRAKEHGGEPTKPHPKASTENASAPPSSKATSFHSSNFDASALFVMGIAVDHNSTFP